MYICFFFLQEEDVQKNHRFQTRHGTRTEIRGNDVPAARELPSRQTVSEVASTRRSHTPRTDNEFTRIPSRTATRQRTESSSTRQFLSRNNRPTEAPSRRRSDNDISTEEVFTRGNVRTRNLEKTRASAFTSRGSAEQESTTSGQYSRGRNLPSRDRDANNQQERPASQVRPRNGNLRQSEPNQSRAGRGRSLVLEEPPTTQSVRSRGRGLEKAVDTRTSRFGDTRLNNVRRNESNRVASSRTSDEQVRDNAAPRSRGRNVGRGRNSVRSEPSPSPEVDTISTKLAEEIPASSSEIPKDTSIQDQLASVNGAQGFDSPITQTLVEASSSEVPLEQSTKKNGGNGITSDLVATEERLKEVSTSRIASEHTTRISARGRTRARNDVSRTSDQRSETEYEANPRTGRRNSQRFTTRSPVSSRTTVERPAGHLNGRGRTRDYSFRVDTTRNGRTEPEITTSNNRARSHLYLQNLQTSSSSTTARAIVDGQTQSYDIAPLTFEKTKNLPAVGVETELNQVVADSEIQANNDSPTTSSSTTTYKPPDTTEHSVPSLLARKLGRGTARASKTEVISCTCYTKAACNFVNCPQV